MSTKKEKEKELKALENFNRENCFICKKCRKKESCFIKPNTTTFCVGFDEGEPWHDPTYDYIKEKDDEFS